MGVNLKTVPRDPTQYHPTAHAGQRAKYRGIDWEHVAATIRDGDLKPSHKDKCVLFVRAFPCYDQPVGVVVDYTQGDILTVELRE